MSTVRHFGLLFYLGVPDSVTSDLYSSEDEKKMAGLQYYLQTVPGASWGRIAGALWYMEEHTALETVRQHLPHKPGEYIVVRGDVVCICHILGIHGYGVMQCWYSVHIVHHIMYM